MDFYKKISIPNFSQIQKKLVVVTEKLFFSGQSTAVIANQSELFEQVPELAAFFQEHKLTYDISRFFLTQPHGSLPIHVDGSEQWPKFLALNIPISGCTGTSMIWWNNVDQIAVSDTLAYGNGIKLFDGASKQIVGQLELTEPALVRIDIPHSVINPTDVARVILTIRFSPEPVELWDNL